MSFGLMQPFGLSLLELEYGNQSQNHLLLHLLYRFILA